MKLTVLGMWGPFAAAGGACSGYLVEGGGTRLLIDCGNGVLGRLQQHCSLDSLDAVVLTHLHADHISDLFILRYALDVARRQGKLTSPLPVYSLPEPEEEFARLPYNGVYDVRSYRPGDEIRIGALALRFAPSRHYIPACAVEVALDGRRFVFSSDTGWSEEVIGLARGADLFLCEANHYREESEGHLNARQAGEMARRAGAGRLLLTHLFPGLDAEAQRADAAGVFNGPVEVAREGATYEIGREE